MWVATNLNQQADRWRNKADKSRYKVEASLHNLQASKCADHRATVPFLHHLWFDRYK